MSRRPRREPPRLGTVAYVVALRHVECDAAADASRRAFLRVGRLKLAGKGSRPASTRADHAALCAETQLGRNHDAVLARAMRSWRAHDAAWCRRADALIERGYDLVRRIDDRLWRHVGGLVHG